MRWAGETWGETSPPYGLLFFAEKTSGENGWNLKDLYIYIWNVWGVYLVNHV